MATKTSGSRQKIEMTKMKNENSLQATFTKRRKSVFNKANELSILCDAEVALIVFSPGGKAFSFGHPSVQSTIEKYLHSENNPSSSSAILKTMNFTERIIEANRKSRLHQMCKELSQLEKLLEDEKKLRNELEKARNEDKGKQWWKAPIDELDLEQLSIYAKALEGLKKDVDKERLSVPMTENGHPHLLNLLGDTNVNGSASVDDMESGSASDLLHGGNVSGRGPFGFSDEKEELDLNRTALRLGSGSGSLGRAEDHQKSIRLHNFI
ncbi:OLC1v1013537C1 [Oldenlandia corymbosa var. corymbosa]|uniref:OLC1v1013537C1 n=1 Tax=Oldenlandia corymbosa var. corymbosa TaxID=529605 RepID=A0AAV1DYG5_OLDCO|nr:OLC1v1013537C1 [Oldenlandia corymbosa var. corymbosa]